MHELMPMQLLEIGVCSWSVAPTDPGELVKEVFRFGLRVVHLAVGPILSLSPADRQRWVNDMRGSGLLVSATMISFPGEDYSTVQSIKETGGLVPESTYYQRREMVLEGAAVTHQLGVNLLTTHVGFIPERANLEAFDKLVARIREILDRLEPLNVALGLETGQESAEQLAAFLEAVERPNVAVNFDPANMILYGHGKTVDAAIRLARWIRHVHAKDARRGVRKSNADWAGEEVPVGSGDARVAEVMAALWHRGYRGPVVIEREAGNTVGRDIAVAVSYLKLAGAALAGGARASSGFSRYGLG